MSARRYAFALSAALSVVPGLAVASETPSEEKRIREIAASYARCVIAESPARARQYVLEFGRPPITGQCLVKATQGSGGVMRFPSQNYRYALADALLAHDFPTGLLPGIKTAAEIPHEGPPPLDEAKLSSDPKKATAVRQALARWRSVWLMSVVGDCAARSDANDAYRLARAEAGSSDELASFDRLKPAIAGCLPGDTTVRFDPAALRGAIVLNLYKIAVSVRNPGDA